MSCKLIISSNREGLNEFVSDVAKLGREIQTMEELLQLYHKYKISGQKRIMIEQTLPETHAQHLLLQETEISASETESDIMAQEGGTLLYQNTATKTQSVELSVQKSLMQKVRVLKFFREFTHITAKELSDRMEGEYHSRSLIAAIENGLRNPTEEFITEYAKALQDRLKVKKNLMQIVQNCIDDQEMMSLMDQYDRNNGGFILSYKISKKILLMDDNKVE